nr:ATP-binding cassette domain-containing protein [uncultured Allomuricauda sp.]
MILEIDNIELSFGSRKVLYGIYLSARQGEVTGILGRNGSGKTSLLKILFGNLKPKYKTIRVDGKNTKKSLFQSNSIAYLPQHRLLPKNLKVDTAFNLFNADWNKFIENFKSFEIYKKYRISQLSSGELRVLETYLIITKKKKIILLDEPFSFIAPVYIERFKEIINYEKKEKIILLTDHFYRDILEVSDTIYLLKDGYSKQINTQGDLVREGYVLPNSR